MLYEVAEKIFNLEMVDRVYRTEYSVLMHSELVRKVTGGMDPETIEAKREFYKRWDICCAQGSDYQSPMLGGYHTSMGHSEYAEHGSDRNDNIFTLFEEPEDALDFDPLEKLPLRTQEELITHFNAGYLEKRTMYPDLLNSTGTYISLMSGMIAMLGWDTLLTCAGIDQKAFGELVNRYAQWMQPTYNALAKCDSPYITLHDDMVWTSGAFISPEWYRKYVFPNYKRLLAPVLAAGKKVNYVCDGNFTEFIDDVMDCGFTSVVIEPYTDMQYIADKYGKTHNFIGNADTRILLLGTKEDIYKEVKRCMDIGKKYPGFIMAVGNHIPPNTPIDNCLYYDEYCKILGKR